MKTLQFSPNEPHGKQWSYGAATALSQADAYNLLRGDGAGDTYARRLLTEAKLRGRGLPVPQSEPPGQPAPQPESSPTSFIEKHAHHVPGASILFAEFYDRFLVSLPPEERPRWSKIKVSRSLPEAHRAGAGTDNKRLVINLSWTPRPASTPLVIVDGKVRKQ